MAKQDVDIKEILGIVFDMIMILFAGTVLIGSIAFMVYKFIVFTDDGIII